jgi:hypothetical protein
MVVACFISGWAFFIYNNSDLKGKSHPKLVTWFLSAFISFLNVTSYKLVSGDMFVTLFPAVNAIMTFLTASFLTFNHIKAGKERKWPDRKDITILLIVIVVIVVVTLLQDTTVATFANILIPACSITAFVPTVRKLEDEDPCPWFIWSGSFLLITVVLLLSWQGRFFALFYPVGGTIGHFAIGRIALKKRKAQRIS